MDSATLAAKIADYDSHKVTSADALNEALGQFGVPEIRKNVAGLRTTVANTTNALNNVDPSVTGRTQGSLVTEAQRQRQVVNERAPIAQQLQSFGGQLGDQEKTLQDATGQATTLATNRVNDYNTGRQALQSQYDTAYKREQDTAAAEAQRQAAIREQTNNDRNYQLALQSSNTKAGAASAKAPTKQDVASHIVSQLNSLKGRDGYVSNETWANALNDFTSAGGTPRQFFQNYSQYVNPKYKEKYAGWVNR
jgi:acetyl/propionyl-CoA carboxylase alpha subunit